MKKENLRVEYVQTADLVPYARNSRTHSEAQVAQIAASIREFGFTNPVLVDPKRTIIAGHGRVLAARTLGIESVPTITLSGLSETQRRAYVIADNRLAENAGWDDELLKLELHAIAEAEERLLALTGFEGDDLSKAMFDDPVSTDDSDEFDEADDSSRNLLLVECRSEKELQALFEEMQERGFECKVMS